jgi:RNA recognition motif-containing protein
MRSSNGPSKLYVGDLGDNRKSDLTRLFSKYGEISTLYFDENKHFAFVEFASSIDAQRALERTNNKTVNGSKLRVEYAKSDKTTRTDHRRALSRDRSPTSILYSHLQVIDSFESIFVEFIVLFVFCLSFN